MSHREDLMAEATALVRRAEFLDADGRSVLVAGYRRDGSLSLYLGEDPVYHFDRGGRLKRAFVDGLLYRTQQTTLARLTRDRSKPDLVGLLRHDLGDDELDTFRGSMIATVSGLVAELDSGRLNQAAVVPESADVAGELFSTLREVLAADEWLAPRFAGKT